MIRAVTILTPLDDNEPRRRRDQRHQTPRRAFNPASAPQRGERPKHAPVRATPPKTSRSSPTKGACADSSAAPGEVAVLPLARAGGAARLRPGFGPADGSPGDQGRIATRKEAMAKGGKLARRRPPDSRRERSALAAARAIAAAAGERAAPLSGADEPARHQGCSRSARRSVFTAGSSNACSWRSTAARRSRPSRASRPIAARRSIIVQQRRARSLHRAGRRRHAQGAIAYAPDLALVPLQELIANLADSAGHRCARWDRGSAEFRRGHSLVPSAARRERDRCGQAPLRAAPPAPATFTRPRRTGRARAAFAVSARSDRRSSGSHAAGVRSDRARLREWRRKPIAEIPVDGPLLLVVGAEGKEPANRSSAPVTETRKIADEQGDQLNQRPVAAGIALYDLIRRRRGIRRARGDIEEGKSCLRR